jgi:mono/diheme cytochrome c family protein
MPALVHDGYEPARAPQESADRTGKKAPKSGSQLWASNCRRCHNLRAPDSLNDDEWEVVVNQMRVRAGLTAQEARRILEFLQSAN